MNIMSLRIDIRGTCHLQNVLGRDESMTVLAAYKELTMCRTNKAVSKKVHRYSKSNYATNNKERVSPCQKSMAMRRHRQRSIARQGVRHIIVMTAQKSIYSYYLHCKGSVHRSNGLVL